MDSLFIYTLFISNFQIKVILIYYKV